MSRTLSFCLLLCPQYQQVLGYVVHSRCSANTSWVNEWREGPFNIILLLLLPVSQTTTHILSRKPLPLSSSVTPNFSDIQFSHCLSVNPCLQSCSDRMKNKTHCLRWYHLFPKFNEQEQYKFCILFYGFHRTYEPMVIWPLPTFPLAPSYCLLLWILLQPHKLLTVQCLLFISIMRDQTSLPLYLAFYLGCSFFLIHLVSYIHSPRVNSNITSLLKASLTFPISVLLGLS